MATLSLKFLTGLGVDEDKAELICERHREVLNEIKEERDALREKADKLDAVQTQLKEAQELAKNAEKDPYKVKYEAMKEEFEAFKSDITVKETTAKKNSAYRKLLKDTGVSEKRIDAIMRVTDLKDLELDDEGNIKEQDKYSKSIKDEWADFIQTKQTEGAKTSTPPANKGSKSTMTKEQIRAIEDPIARQKAMIENPSLFGLPDNSEE